MDKTQKQEIKRKLSIWETIGWIILIIIEFNFFSKDIFGDSKEEIIRKYSNCVSYCVSDIDNCMYEDRIYDNGNAYVRGYHSDYCVSELDSCVYDCKP